MAHEFSAYVEDDVDLTSNLRANIGFHFSSFRVQGKTFFSLQPRLSARYQLGEATTLKASFSRMNQYINLLTSAPISMPTDLWVPVTKNLKPMLSHQYVLGERATNYYGVFEDSWFKDSEYTLNVQVELYKGYSWFVKDFTPRYMDMEVKVRLLSITEIEYYYLTIMNVIDSDVLDEFVNDPVAIPSNVYGGTGFVGISSESGKIIRLIDGEMLDVMPEE